jgi:small-conductance mechanosensitive channel
MEHLTPGQQAYYHAGCAMRHLANAGAAFSRSSELRAWAIGFLCAALLVGLCGCNAAPVTPPADPAVVQPIADAAEAARIAAEEAAKAHAAKESKLSASAEVIARQNEQAPDSPQKPVIAAEVALIQQTLAVTPSAEDRAAAAERETLMLAGRLEEARAKYHEASSAADKLNAAIATANAQRDAAQAELAAAIADASAKLTAQQAQHERDMAAKDAAWQRRLDDAKAAIRNGQVAKLNWFGFGCQGAAVLCIGLGFAFGGLPALRRLGPVALFVSFCGLAAFALARVIGHPWFMPIMLSLLGIVAVWVAVWLHRHYRLGDLKREIDTRAGKVNAVLGDVVGGVEAVRAKLKEAGSITKAEADKLLREWVTEHDGTAAAVDAIRREKGLIS